MVKIYRAPSIKPFSNRHVNPIEPACTEGERIEMLGQEVIVDRRRSAERRQEPGERGPFDMRTRRDRRKNQPGSPSIEVDA